MASTKSLTSRWTPFLALAAAVSFSQAALAQEQIPLGTYKPWGDAEADSLVIAEGSDPQRTDDFTVTLTRDSGSWTGDATLTGNRLRGTLTADEGIVGTLDPDSDTPKSVELSYTYYAWGESQVFYGARVPAKGYGWDFWRYAPEPAAPGDWGDFAFTVEDAYEIEDAAAPHYAADRSEPAAIQMNTNLRLSVTLPETANGQTLVGEAGELSFRADVAGSPVTVESNGVVHAGVTVTDLEIAWKLVDSAGAETALAATPLRIFTLYDEPRKNIEQDQQTPNTKAHLALACHWADGATEPLGEQGTIGHNIDNAMVHHLHPSDSGLTGKSLLVPVYEEGSEAPANYEDLDGYVRTKLFGGASFAVRSVASLYYPPLEPNEPYEEYTNYQDNYGWWLLDNPEYTGGRCNQQAALVAAILGTVGIQAKVHYLERFGLTEDGRWARQYFYADGGSGPWNFHGVCLATVTDPETGEKSEHIYDGSFSWPPRRKNGSREWAEGPGGPFIQSWGPWLYQDAYGGRVPEGKEPKEWYGVNGTLGER
jgi:hypothetical protein